MPGKKFTIEKELEICQEYTSTNSTHVELAIKYNCSRDTIISTLQRFKIKRKYVHSNTKLKNLIKCNEDYFETIDTSDKSYWLGFITADARIDEEVNTLTIKLGIKDKDHLEEFLMMLESEHNIRRKYESLKTTGKTYETCVVKICRPKIISDLTKHGITQNKSKELSIPKTIPDELLNAFVRGYIDGDGCISIDRNNRISISYLSSIKSFSEEIKNLLIEKCNVNDNKILYKPGCFVIRWTNINQCERIYKYLYSDEGPKLNRKYQIAKNYFDNPPNIKSKVKRPASEIENSKIIKENPKILSNLDKILGFGK